MNAKEVFEKEWALYRGGVGHLRESAGFWSDVGRRQATGGDFDGEVKVGEYRIFADMDKPFVALIVEDCGLSGWRIVPVSPFTVPASPREMLVGERVLQLWNSCVASRRFVERSWRVDDISREDLADVAERLGKTVVGRIVAGKGPEAEYEKVFLVSGGNFAPLVEKTQVMRPVGIWRRYGGWGLAAMLMICFGVTWMLYQEQLKSHEALRLENIRRVKAGDAEVRANSGELCEEVEVECAEAAAEPQIDVKIDFDIPTAPVVAPCPALRKSAASDRCQSVAVIKSPITMKSMNGSRYSMRESRESAWQDHGTERYAEFSENEFHDPRSNPLSTFSLDVDTSSYTLMRRYVMDGKRLPPKTSVRLEEWVNYFRYSYPQPSGKDPVAVDCEMAACPWKKGHLLLRLGVQARNVAEKRLPPCNLTFLIDRSGSMNCNNGMSLLKSGLNMLVDKLRDKDRVSIVTYASGTEVLLGSTPGSEKVKIHEVVNSLTASGCTYGAGGLQLAYDEAMRNFDSKANNRVILVTDGDFNVGISSPKELEDFIAQKRKSGIFLSVIGVGRGNYQDASMKKLANAGNGNYAYLDSVLEAKKVMMTEFGGTLFTVAKDVKVQVEFNPAQVAGYRLLGYENRMLKAKDFNDDKKDAGEIGAGHSMTAFYEIVPAGDGKPVASVDPLKYQTRTDVGGDDVFTLKMRWKAPKGGKSVLREVAKTRGDITRAEPSEDFRFASAVAEFALVLGDSKFKGKASVKAAAERARKAKGADAEGWRAEFVRIAELAEILQNEGK